MTLAVMVQSPPPDTQPNRAAVAAGKGREGLSHSPNDPTVQISMKNHSESHPRLDPAPPEPTPVAAQDDTPDLLRGDKLFRSWPQPEDNDADDDDTARLPGITSLPEGIEVVEHELGRAVGQWILMVRCQCGKRWFELEAIDTATCPRCNRLVYVDALDTPRD
jgi:hypothetical protein